MIEEIMPAGDWLTGIVERFARDAERQTAALRRLGIDARVGEVPGEYCPGAFTVNAAGRRKLIGAAQRAARGGWLLSTVVVIESAARVRQVLERVYASLELDWDPATVGAVAEEAPGVSVEAVEQLVLGVYSQRYDLVPGHALEPGAGRGPRGDAQAPGDRVDSPLPAHGIDRSPNRREVA